MGVPVSFCYDPRHAGPSVTGGRMASGVPLVALDGNRILALLPPADRAHIAERMQPYRSEHEILLPAGGEILYAHFPSSGLLPVLPPLTHRKPPHAPTP